MLWGQHLVRSAVTGAAPATFVETVRYLEVYHQVAPKEMAQNTCSQCHGQVGD